MDATVAKFLWKPLFDKLAHQVPVAGQFDQEIKDQRQGDGIDDLCHQRDLEQSDIGQDHK